MPRRLLKIWSRRYNAYIPFHFDTFKCSPKLGNIAFIKVLISLSVFVCSLDS